MPNALRAREHLVAIARKVGLQLVDTFNCSSNLSVLRVLESVRVLIMSPLGGAWRVETFKRMARVSLRLIPKVSLALQSCRWKVYLSYGRQFWAFGNSSRASGLCVRAFEACPRRLQFACGLLFRAGVLHLRFSWWRFQVVFALNWLVRIPLRLRLCGALRFVRLCFNWSHLSLKLQSIGSWRPAHLLSLSGSTLLLASWWLACFWLNQAARIVFFVHGLPPSVLHLIGCAGRIFAAVAAKAFLQGVGLKLPHSSRT